MIEIRLHDRGGRKLGLWAEALARAALKDGKYSQSHLSFGLDRAGAPNTAITRIAPSPIRQRAGNASAPDVIVVLDPSIVDLVDVTAGLKGSRTLVMPTGTPLFIPVEKNWRVHTVDTTGLAPAQARAALLDGVLTITQIASSSSLQAAIQELKLE